MERIEARFALLTQLLVACGIAALCAVAAGGIVVGAMLAVAVHANGFAFVSFEAAGLLGSLASWIGICAYAAKRNTCDLVVLMRRASLIYGAWLLTPAVLLVPSLRSHSGACGFFAATAALSIVLARYSVSVRIALFAFATTRTVVFVVASAAAVLLPVSGIHVPLSANPLIDAATHWDGVHYLTIAERGYLGQDLAFFPLYPTSIRILSFFGGPVVAAIAVSNVAFLIALVLLHRYVSATRDEELAARTVFYLAIFPTAFFFSAVYSESLFLMLSLGMFVMVRDGKWLSAGFLGGLAALTRVEGVFLVVPMLIEIFTQQKDIWIALRFDRDFSRRIAIAVGMVPLGLLAYMFLSLILSGNPLYFTTVQVHWHRSLALPWVGIWRAVSLVFTSHDATTVAIQATELTFTVLIVAAIAGGWRYLRPPERAYAALSVIVPLSTSSLMSMPRFALTLFPMFVVMAILGRTYTWDRLITIASLTLLGFFTALFASWHWVA